MNAAGKQLSDAQYLDPGNFFAASVSGTESVTITSSICDAQMRSTAGPESTACVQPA